MTQEQFIEKMQIMIDDNSSNTGVLSVYLDLARDVIKKRLYPFANTENVELDSRYDYKVLEIACYLYNKRGAEGETSHSENGVSRAYENGHIPQSMLADLIPFAGVPK